MSRPPNAPKPARRPSPRTTGKPSGPVARAGNNTRKKQNGKKTAAAASKSAPACAAAGAKKSRRNPLDEAATSRLSVLTRWSARLRWLLRIPGFVYMFIGVVLVVVLVPSINWVYQVVRKPSELFFPVSDDWYKTQRFLKNGKSLMRPHCKATCKRMKN